MSKRKTDQATLLLTALREISDNLDSFIYRQATEIVNVRVGEYQAQADREVAEAQRELEREREHYTAVRAEIDRQVKYLDSRNWKLAQIERLALSSDDPVDKQAILAIIYPTTEKK